MKVSLEALQAQVYALCSEYSQERFFLRRALSHDCLWVSDIPRFANAGTLEVLRKALNNQGFFTCIAEKPRLLRIDLTKTKYAVFLKNFPILPPSFPEDEALHLAYGLCRLMLSHPAPFREQPLEPLREILKAVSSSKECRLSVRIPALSRQCAEWLREEKPLPHAAGRVLAQWLATLSPLPFPEGESL